jgi:hypothetical protein
MKTLFGAIIVDGRGKLGGHVGQKNASGTFLRTKTSPVNRRSSAQQSRRSLVADLTKSWASLTDAQRLLWINWAVLKPVTNVFGKTFTKSGFNMFVEVNLNLVNVGEERSLDPDTAEVVAEIFYDWGVGFDVEDASGIIVTFNPPIDSVTKVIVFATQPTSAGMNSGGSLYRQIAILDDTAISPYSIADQYKAKFGHMGPTDTKIFTKAIQINLRSGLAYPPLIASGIVPTFTPPP